MEKIRDIGFVESIIALNFLVYVAIWLFDFGLVKTRIGLTFSIDIVLFIPLVISAVPAIIASIYGLKSINKLHGDERSRRMVICIICLFANAALLSFIIVPGNPISFTVTDLHSIFHKLPE